MKTFKKGQILYSVSVTSCLVVTVSESIVDRAESRSDGMHYDLKVLKNHVIRDYEIPLSKKELAAIEESVRSWYNHDDPREPIIYHSSSGRGGEGLYDKLTKEIIKSEVTKQIAQNKKVEKYEEKLGKLFVCPLTGGKLTAIPDHSWGTLDAGTEYKAEGSGLIWHTGGLGGCFYTTTYKGEKRIFDWNNWKWEEKIKCGNRYIDKPTTKKGWKEFEAAKEKFDLEQKAKQEQYEADVKSGKIKEVIWPKISPVYASTAKMELVKVAPMPPPTGLLFYMEELDPDGKPKVYPPTIETTLKELLKITKLTTKGLIDEDVKSAVEKVKTELSKFIPRRFLDNNEVDIEKKSKICPNCQSHNTETVRGGLVRTNGPRVPGKLMSYGYVKETNTCKNCSHTWETKGRL